VAFSLPVIDLGRLPYEPAYQTQLTYLEEVMAAREAGQAIPGYLLLVEHDPVITISRRAGASNHLLATPALLEKHGVSMAETDRGGDITYHGPGQLVVYPILDLNLLNLGLHEYMRLLEQAVMDVCATHGIATHRDAKATGVWVDPGDGHPAAKIAAMGVRVRRWVSMHGLALNVSTNLEHFSLIVPCGLAGRPVTSLKQLLGEQHPNLATMKVQLAQTMERLIEQAWRTASDKRLSAEESARNP
jgi:lipoyl(octanoyl) transferase